MLPIAPTRGDWEEGPREHVYTRDSLACCLPPAGPPVVLASTRDTLPRGIPYVYAPRLFNGGRSVALKRYKKTSPPPNPGKPHRVFSPDSPTGYFMGRCANYPGRNSIVSFVTRIPNFRTFVYDSIFGQAACARVWVGGRATRR